jgi:hypothetical protein
MEDEVADLSFLHEAFREMGRLCFNTQPISQMDHAAQPPTK